MVQQSKRALVAYCLKRVLVGIIVLLRVSIRIFWRDHLKSILT